LKGRQEWQQRYRGNSSTCKAEWWAEDGKKGTRNSSTTEATAAAVAAVGTEVPNRESQIAGDAQRQVGCLGCLNGASSLGGGSAAAAVAAGEEGYRRGADV